jgi:hypothetical protein
MDLNKGFKGMIGQGVESILNFKNAIIFTLPPFDSPLIFSPPDFKNPWEFRLKKL